MWISAIAGLIVLLHGATAGNCHNHTKSFQPIRLWPSLGSACSLCSLCRSALVLSSCQHRPHMPRQLYEREPIHKHCHNFNTCSMFPQWKSMRAYTHYYNPRPAFAVCIIISNNLLYFSTCRVYKCVRIVTIILWYYITYNTLLCLLQQWLILIYYMHK